MELNVSTKKESNIQSHCMCKKYFDKLTMNTPDIGNETARTVATFKLLGTILGLS